MSLYFDILTWGLGGGGGGGHKLTSNFGWLVKNERRFQLHIVLAYAHTIVRNRNRGGWGLGCSIAGSWRIPVWDFLPNFL